MFSWKKSKKPKILIRIRRLLCCTTFNATPKGTEGRSLANNPLLLLCVEYYHPKNVLQIVITFSRKNTEVCGKIKKSLRLSAYTRSYKANSGYLTPPADHVDQMEICGFSYVSEFELIAAKTLSS